MALRLGPQQEMYMTVRGAGPEDQERPGDARRLDGDGRRQAPGYKVFDLAVYVCTKNGAIVTQLKPTIGGARDGQRTRRKMDVAMMAAVGKGLQ